MKKYLLLTNFN